MSVAGHCAGMRPLLRLRAGDRRLKVGEIAGVFLPTPRSRWASPIAAQASARRHGVAPLDRPDDRRRPLRSALADPGERAARAIRPARPLQRPRPTVHFDARPVDPRRVLAAALSGEAAACVRPVARLSGARGAPTFPHDRGAKRRAGEGDRGGEAGAAAAACRRCTCGIPPTAARSTSSSARRPVVPRGHADRPRGAGAAVLHRAAQGPGRLPSW